MARPGDVAALANFARDKLGTVDLWCAAASTHVAAHSHLPHCRLACICYCFSSSFMCSFQLPCMHAGACAWFGVIHGLTHVTVLAVVGSSKSHTSQDRLLLME